MERGDVLKLAEDILGEDFIGPLQLNKIYKNTGLNLITESDRLPELTITQTQLEEIKNNKGILFLFFPFLSSGEQLTIHKMRDIYGLDNTSNSNVGFYNQDWYSRESFYLESYQPTGWYVMQKHLSDDSRSKLPDINNKEVKLPSALVATYLFFIYYIHSQGNILWKHDYLWCKDLDHNGDMIYVGRYEDPHGINKNGFSIHRHLRLSSLYGYSNCYKVE